MEVTDINIGIAFLAGLASFLSPCILPIVPAYISYLSGRTAVASISDMKVDRLNVLSHALAFISGFSFIFISLGLAISVLGQVLRDLRPILTVVGGHFVVLFGLHMTGIIRIPLLDNTFRPQTIPDRRWGYLSSFIMGIFFSIGWTPCISIPLGSILYIAGIEGSISRGLVLLAAYSLGLALPFLFAATQISLFAQLLRKYGKLVHYVEVGMGLLLAIIGALLIQNKLTWFASLGSSISINGDETNAGLILLFLLVGLGILGLIPAIIAKRKGRDFLNWWFFGAGLFPIALYLALKLSQHQPSGPGVTG